MEMHLNFAKRMIGGLFAVDFKTTKNEFKA